MIQQPITVYEAVQEPTAQTTIVDVLVGVVWVVFGLAAVAVVLGLGCAGVLIMVRRLRRGEGRTSSESDATTLGLEPSSSSPSVSRKS